MPSDPTHLMSGDHTLCGIKRKSRDALPYCGVEHRALHEEAVASSGGWCPECRRLDRVNRFLDGYFEEVVADGRGD